MAKMFYTIEEVAQKLGKSEDDVKDMAASGQIQEFRDRDKLMFKVDQIDLLASGDEEADDITLNLEDSAAGGSGLGLAASGSAGGMDVAASGSGLDLQEESSLGLADSREGTGISIFDTDHAGDDASDQTHVSGEAEAIAEGEDELSLESVGSGSGLLDLTRESDDTSLGAELLEEVYSSEENIEVPAHASGLFEAAGAESPGEVMGEPAGAAVPMVVEAYDGAGSGLGVGLLVGAFAALVCVALIGIVGVSGATPALAISFAGNLMVWAGGLLGITIICGLIGLFIGKASE